MAEIYVGNLRYDVTVDDVHQLFAPFGPVYSVDVHGEAGTGRPHAFAFVEMDGDDADQAIRQLDGMDFYGRTLKVQPAREVAVQRS